MEYDSKNREHPLPVLISLGTEPTLVNKTGLWRFLTPVKKEKLSPCRGNCPLENGIPSWMKSVKKDDLLEAWAAIEKYNPFPALTGYVCYRFCEEDCNRGYLDEPITIGELEKNIGLFRLENYKETAKVAQHKLKLQHAVPRKIGVVGSGPAGLSCAYYLNKLGADVTVFEKLPLAGGLLATGIPGHRLPREVLRKELDILQKEGIRIITGIEVGKDSTLDELNSDCDMLVLAVGAQESRNLGVGGEDLPGAIPAIKFLRNIYIKGKNNLKGRVVVVGGGDAAVDAAYEARRSGAEEVFVLYRRGREEMPASAAGIEEAQKQNVQFHFNVDVKNILGKEKVTHVHVAQTMPSKRFEKVERLPGSEFYMDCDYVIIAAGQQSSLPGVTETEGFQKEEKSAFMLLHSHGKHIPLVVVGDAAAGPANVARAIFGGRQAALFLSQHLGLSGGKAEEILAGPLEQKNNVVKYEELNPLLFPHSEAKNSPREEAERCFSCGWCSNCGVCWIFCPDIAVGMEEENYEILLDYCKGCGICVTECPSGVLDMEEGGENLSC